MRMFVIALLLSSIQIEANYADGLGIRGLCARAMIALKSAKARDDFFRSEGLAKIPFSRKVGLFVSDLIRSSAELDPAFYDYFKKRFLFDIKHEGQAGGARGFKAANQALGGSGGSRSSESGKNLSSLKVLEVLDRPNIFYFRQHILPGLAFRSGFSFEIPILNEKERKLRPGVPAATLNVKNHNPDELTSLYIPEGFRVLPSEQQVGAAVSVSAYGEAVAISNQKESFNILLAKNMPMPLSPLELAVYTRVEEPVELHELPVSFQIKINLLLNYIKENPKTKASQITELIVALIHNEMKYTGRENNGDLIEVLQLAKIQCSWAAVIAAGILRQFFHIPTRIIQGRLGITHKNRSGETWLLEEPQTHAWIESYDFSSQQWLTYDPTPPTPADDFNPEPEDDEYFSRPPRAGASDSWNEIDGWTEDNIGRENSSTAALRYANDTGNHDFLISFKDWRKARGLPPPAGDAFTRAVMLQTMDALWVKTLRSYDSMEHLLNSLELFSYLMSDIESRGIDIGYQDIFEYFRMKNEKLKNKLLVWGIYYRDLSHLADQLKDVPREDSDFTQNSALDFLFCLMTDISFRSKLSADERNLLKTILGMKIEKIEIPEFRDESLFHAIRTPHLKARAKKIIDEIGDIAFATSASGETNGTIAEWISILKEMKYFPFFRSFDRGLAPTYQERDVKVERVPVSDSDPDYQMAFDFSNWKRFRRGTLPPHFDLIRLMAGEMEEQVHDEVVLSSKESERPPTQVTIIGLGENFHTNYRELTRAAIDFSQRRVHRGQESHEIWIGPVDRNISEDGFLKLRDSNEIEKFYSDLSSFQPGWRSGDLVDMALQVLKNESTARPEITRANFIQLAERNHFTSLHSFSQGIEIEFASHGIRILGNEGNLVSFGSKELDINSLKYKELISVSDLSLQIVLLRHRIQPSRGGSLSESERNEIAALISKLGVEPELEISDAQKNKVREILTARANRNNKDEFTRTSIERRSHPWAYEPVTLIRNHRFLNYHVMSYENRFSMALAILAKVAKTNFGITLEEMAWRLTDSEVDGLLEIGTYQATSGEDDW